MSLKTSLAALVLALLATSPVVTQSPPRSPASALPADMPDQLRPVTDTFDYVKRVVMIPMRDGVKLHTIILIPKGAARAPILLTRTPYEAKTLTVRRVVALLRRRTERNFTGASTATYVVTCELRSCSACSKML